MKTAAIILGTMLLASGIASARIGETKEEVGDRFNRDGRLPDQFDGRLNGVWYEAKFVNGVVVWEQYRVDGGREFTRDEFKVIQAKQPAGTRVLDGPSAVAPSGFRRSDRLNRLQDPNKVGTILTFASQVWLDAEAAKAKTAGSVKAF